MNRYKAVLEHKREILAKRPDKAEVEVGVSSRQVGGLKSIVKARGFEITVDMPGGFDGGDAGPRPASWCSQRSPPATRSRTASTRTIWGIPLDSVAVNVSGISDARPGFLGPDQDPPIRAGYRQIHGEIVVESPASDEDLDRLRHAVNEHCPVLDDLRSALPGGARVAPPRRGHVSPWSDVPAKPEPARRIVATWIGAVPGNADSTVDRFPDLRPHCGRDARLLVVMVSDVLA